MWKCEINISKTSHLSVIDRHKPKWRINIQQPDIAMLQILDTRRLHMCWATRHNHAGGTTSWTCRSERQQAPGRPQTATSAWQSCCVWGWNPPRVLWKNRLVQNRLVQNSLVQNSLVQNTAQHSTHVSCIRYDYTTLHKTRDVRGVRNGWMYPIHLFSEKKTLWNYAVLIF